MGKTLADLAKSLRKKASMIESGANELVKDAAKAALRELVVVTPVDTSEALSNWQVGIGAKISVPMPPHFIGRRGSTRGASSAKAIQEGEEAINSKAPGVSVYISNVNRYIGDLDRGTSAQFSGGFGPIGLLMIRVTVQKSKTIFK